MKKRILAPSGIIVVVVLLISSMVSVFAADPPSGATVVDLIAGQNEDVGDVSIWNDNDNIYVKYETVANWYLLETHFHIAPTCEEIPQTGNHNPIPGHFTYSGYFDIADEQQEWSISFPIPEGMNYGDDVAIAAHAVVTTMCEENALANPGAEAGDLSGWSHDVSIRASESRLENTGIVYPRSGAYFFDMTAEPDYASWMYQVVNLAEYVGDRISAGGWIQSEYDDYGQFTVSFYDGSDTLIEQLDSGIISNSVEASGAAGYAEFNMEGAIPKGASTAEYLLNGFLDNGDWINVFYDDLYLQIWCTETAWGDGTDFNAKRNWGMWVEYTINTPS